MDEFRGDLTVWPRQVVMTDEQRATWQAAALRADRAAQERKEAANRRREQRAVAAKAKRRAIAEHDERVAAATGLRRAVLELHGPDRAPDADPCETLCEGCDYSGYESDAGAWPCRTYTLARDYT